MNINVSGLTVCAGVIAGAIALSFWVSKDLADFKKKLMLESTVPFFLMDQFFKNDLHNFRVVEQEAIDLFMGGDQDKISYWLNSSVIYAQN